MANFSRQKAPPIFFQTTQIQLLIKFLCYIPNFEALSGIRIMAAIRKLYVDVFPQKVALTYPIHTVDKIRSSHKMVNVDHLWTMPRRVE